MAKPVTSKGTMNSESPEATQVDEMNASGVDALNAAEVNAPSVDSVGSVKAAAQSEYNWDEWVDEQVGFAPYWDPEEGSFIVGTIMAKDEADPLFPRYVLVSSFPVTCKRGPAEEAELVRVAPGEPFTISVYHSLRPAFDLYCGCEFPVEIRVDAIDKVDTKNNRKVWRWRLRVKQSTKVLLQRHRRALMLAQGQKAERPAIEA